MRTSRHDLNQNRIGCAVVALASELTAWAKLLALTELPSPGGSPAPAAHRAAPPARPRPWAALLPRAITTLRPLAAPG